MKTQISRINKLYFVQLIAIVILLSLSACNTALYYDQYAYKEGISIKVDALVLIDKSTENFEDHKDEAERIKVAMMKLFEYEKYRKNNAETIKMWEIMMDPEKSLYAGYIAMWEKKGKMSKVFLKEAKKNIEQGFNIIIGFENKKIKPNK